MSLVNVMECIDGEEWFLTAVNTTGHKNDMPYFFTVIETYICANTDLIVTDGACGGLLNLVYLAEARQVHCTLQIQIQFFSWCTT